MRSAGFRFLLAGGLAAAVNWLVRFPFSSIMPFAAAMVAAQVVGWAVGFVLYRAFVFQRSGRSLWNEMILFLTVNIVSLAGVLILALGTVALLTAAGLDPFRAEAIAHGAGIAFGAVLNFLGHRAFTFAAVDRTRALTAAD